MELSLICHTQSSRNGKIFRQHQFFVGKKWRIFRQVTKIITNKAFTDKVSFLAYLCFKWIIAFKDEICLSSGIKNDITLLYVLRISSEIFQLEWKVIFVYCISIHNDSPQNWHLNCLTANVSTSDQRCFNVVNQRSSNIDPTRKIKQNPTSDFQCCTILIQLWRGTLKQVSATLIQCSRNVIFQSLGKNT